ncbi:MAG: hypothetical protein ABI689_18395 [Thermoanaerobaculia bacterium]
MNNKRWAMLAVVVMVAAMLTAAPAAAGSAYHKYFMKGSIIEASEEGIYLCIGTEDGAKAGQVLDVMRVSRDTSGASKSGPKFKREKVGTVEILAVVDEHFARAKKVSGEAGVSDMVELEVASK